MNQKNNHIPDPVVLAVISKVESGYMATVYHTFTYPDGTQKSAELARTNSPVPDVDELYTTLTSHFPELGPREVETESE